MKRYKYSLGAIVRILNPMIFCEWIQHNINLGFEHFYLYDNKGVFSLQELCGTLGDKVTVHQIDDDMAQIPVYNHCIHTYKGETEYLALIDDDEFINFADQYNTLDEVVSSMNEPDALIMNWIFMGCGQQRLRSIKQYLIDTNQWSHPTWNTHTKWMFRPDKVQGLVNPHWVIPYTGAFTFKDGANDVPGGIQGFHSLANDPVIWICHYWRMSMNDFRLKCEHTVAAPLTLTDVNFFKREFERDFAGNANDNTPNFQMKRWVEKLKSQFPTPVELMTHYLNGPALPTIQLLVSQRNHPPASPPTP